MSTKRKCAHPSCTSMTWFRFCANHTPVSVVPRLCEECKFPVARGQKYCSRLCKQAARKRIQQETAQAFALGNSVTTDWGKA